MLSVIVAQFLSAFGDNALLFATLALLKAQFYPDWSQPVLQMVFVGAYILFAPFVGQIADSFAKGRVMMVANGLKLAGAAGICLGINPFVGYTLVGIGAAAYSPAKYGILGELTTGDKLVKANGLMEASTIAAILLGSVAGGVLADWHVIAALVACALAYAGAVAANLFIPKLVAARPGQSWRLSAMTRSFFSACVVLWRNGETRFSLVGTGLFWGAGVTLRFLLVLWVPVALGITDNATPTYLNAMVAVGIVVGAGAAAKLVTLETVSRCMPAGILIGVVVAIFSLQHALLPAYALLLLIGMLGGFFVVPLNALLQERGKKSVGAGNAIAVQNLGENSAMLLMLGLYSLAVLVGVPAVAIGIGFGVLFALAIAALWIWQRHRALTITAPDRYKPDAPPQSPPEPLRLTSDADFPHSS
ncbi:lysophospholipid transporter LplT [Salmonella enterica]|nr:lysophospholipid transporter LplT [Salmonella enterica]EBA8267535.1 lysophospholipid transporter LplT [Salmonella enterica subsp. enterica serovar Newport]EAW5426111.1 lysophospholipid transporter LplT [Salmonella enterica]EBA9338206.1 lysophospholipid transporter LplT [Salmonella enterica subsp. enterica serovar Newport]EBB2192311.1 lysophospholipid transporter LplT [Salmonella enterica]